MDSEINNVKTTSGGGKDKPWKRIRHISEEYGVYAEIKLDAIVIDEKLVKYNYEQQHITKAAVYLLHSQGELTLTIMQRNLVIDFDFIETERGYEITLEWAQFGEHNSYKLYKSNQKISVSIPVGSSTINNMKMEYLVLQKPHKKEGISLTIIEANIHRLSSNEPEHQSLKNKFDKIFDENKGMKTEVIGEKPKNNHDY